MAKKELFVKVYYVQEYDEKEDGTYEHRLVLGATTSKKLAERYRKVADKLFPDHCHVVQTTDELHKRYVEFYEWAAKKED